MYLTLFHSLSLSLSLSLCLSFNFCNEIPKVGHQVWEMEMLGQVIHSCIYRAPAMCLEMGQVDKAKTNKAQCSILKG